MIDFGMRCYTLGRDVLAGVGQAMDAYEKRNGKRPPAVVLHPARLADTTWPADWPSLVTSPTMNRDLVGLEERPPPEQRSLW